MSKTAKIAVIILVVVVIAIIGWIIYSQMQKSSTAQTKPNTAVTQSAPVVQTQMSATEIEKQGPAALGMTPLNDTSDAAIQADTTALDAQISGLNSDSSEVDANLNK